MKEEITYAIIRERVVTNYYEKSGSFQDDLKEYYDSELGEDIINYHYFGIIWKFIWTMGIPDGNIGILKCAMEMLVLLKGILK